LHSVGVSVVKVGYPKYIAQENGDFSNVHIWTYGYLLRRIYEVAEEEVSCRIKIKKFEI